MYPPLLAIDLGSKTEPTPLVVVIADLVFRQAPWKIWQ